MPLEEATYISDLVATNPVHATDDVSAGDDHIRLIKAAVKATFPNISGAVTVTHTVLNGVQNASNLTSGTVADARLSINVPLLNAASNAFSGNMTVGGTLGVTGNVSLTAALSVGGNLTLTGTINGVSTSDLARLSQINSFAADQVIAKDASPTLYFYNAAENVQYGFIQGASTTFNFGTSTALPVDIYTSNAHRLSIGSDGNFDFKAGTVTTANASASEVGYKGVPPLVLDDDHTLAAADDGKNLVLTVTGKTIAIPAQASVPIPDGFAVTLTGYAVSGSWTIGRNSGVALYLAGTNFSNGDCTLAGGGMATLTKIEGDNWMINGTGLSQ